VHESGVHGCVDVFTRRTEGEVGLAGAGSSGGHRVAEPVACLDGIAPAGIVLVVIDGCRPTIQSVRGTEHQDGIAGLGHSSEMSVAGRSSSGSATPPKR
jgi:hypothetical protein